MRGNPRKQRIKNLCDNRKEEPLLPNSNCLLGSLNLAEFVDDNGMFLFDQFSNAATTGVRALDNVLDEGIDLLPLEAQKEMARRWRPIGLGIFGLADALIKMHIEYGSDEAVDICNNIGYKLASSAICASNDLAASDGHFPACHRDRIIETAFFKNNAILSPSFRDQVLLLGLRNSQLLTIAPTGTLSTMLGVSGGIEPIFANYYTRTTKSLHGKDVAYKVYTPIVEKFMKDNGLTDDSKLPNYFVTAQTLDYEKRIAMQSIWQKHIDASISSTVNLPEDTSVEVVEAIYMEAWKAGLKGITIFRDGCKRAGILTTHTDSNSKSNSPTELPRGYILETSNDLIGKKRRLTTGCGSLHVTAFFDPYTGDLIETYLSKGSSGGCQNFMVGLSRMITLSARAGADIHSIVDQLNSTGACPSYAVRRATKGDTSKGSCCPMAVGNALVEMWHEMRTEITPEDEESADQSMPTGVKHPCPQCGAELVFEGGCNVCKSCAWSRCE